MAEFSKKSWHYRMASHISNDWELNHYMTICTYVRKVLLGLLFFIGLAASAGAAVVLNIGGLILLFQGSWVGSGPGMFHLANAATATLLVLFGVPATWHHFEMNWRLDKFFRATRRKLTFKKYNVNDAPVYRRHEPSFLVVWYRSIKDKFCFRVRFYDED